MNSKKGKRKIIIRVGQTTKLFFIQPFQQEDK
jgi:hypothetical protein